MGLGKKKKKKKREKKKKFPKKKGLTELFPGVIEFKGRIYTKNLVPGEKVYGEKLVKIKGNEFREWSSRRSKLAAGLKKGLRFFPFKKDSLILYLGSAEGTTVSHLSDVLEGTGLIFGVDVSARVMRKFLWLCEQRKNLVPIMASANKPEEYKKFLPEKVDALFQDVSQKNQTEIFLKNVQEFLKSGGVGILSLKSRSIDVVKKPEKVFQEEKSKLEKELEVLQLIPLKPFEKDHALFVCRKK